LEALLLYALPVPEGDREELEYEALVEYVTVKGVEALEARERFLEEQLGSPDVVKEFEKYVLLQTIDERWMDHLHELDYVKEGIHLRAYAQKDPLVEYKKEAYGLFTQLNATIDSNSLHAFFHARIAARERPRHDLASARAVHQESDVYAMQQSSMAAAPHNEAALKPGAGAGGPQPQQPKTREMPKVGRNDPCPCGSGKKYKKCHGAA
jgi:preprotein translocase subunit SecA